VGLRVSIDGDKCMGSGNCLFWAAEVFGLSDDGVAFIVAQPGDEDTARKVRQAAEGCPTQAIVVETED
jgi:ferredoxin